MRANKGEWAEPYAALRLLSEMRLYLANERGEKNINEWMEIVELIRHETLERVVTYRYNPDKTDILIFVNDNKPITISVADMQTMAEAFSDEIKSGRGRSFEVSVAIREFLYRAQILHIKARSIEKSDMFLTIVDPRVSIERKHIGFSIKSEFGQPPTLFNTAKASAAVYRISGMTKTLMDQVNGLMDERNHVAVGARCDLLMKQGCNLEFIGFPYAERAKCHAFSENLDLIDPRLGEVINRILWRHFFEHDTNNDICHVIEMIVEENPCNLARPEVKYPHMFKNFLYAAYCGMTASSLWDGKSQVNGGFIRVKGNGEVLAFYALESDLFKDYLYNKCFLEYPSTADDHGNYAKVYEENGEYYYRLNFQIRYRITD